MDLKCLIIGVIDPFSDHQENEKNLVPGCMDCVVMYLTADIQLYTSTSAVTSNLCYYVMYYVFIIASYKESIN